MTQTQRNYYEILGVAKDATQDQIKKAYRKAAQTYHPDVNKAADASDKMKLINEAYDVLGDTDKRAHYDRFGSTSQAQYQQGRAYNPYQGQGQGYTSFDDLMAEMLRQYQRQAQQQQSTRQRTVYPRQTSFVGLIFRIMYGLFLLQIIYNLVYNLFR